MAFYVLIYSIACIAALIAVLTHWPELDDPDDKRDR